MVLWPTIPVWVLEPLAVYLKLLQVKIRQKSADLVGEFYIYKDSK